MSFRQVERKQAKLRMALTGVSNSGKTMGAMKIAKGMGGRMFFINTEKEGPDVYDDLFQENLFEVWDIDAPYTPEKYIEAICACESAGAEVIIIDSLSHGWSGTGGILDIQSAATEASKSKNSYMAWRDVTPRHNRLIDTILQSSAHVIVTMRSKTQHEVVDIGGKKAPVKIGLAPIQRDGLEYEFTLMLEIDHNSHLFTASKDRTRIFEGRHEILSEIHGDEIMKWLNKGACNEDNKKQLLESIKITFNECKSIESLRNIYIDFMKKYPLYKENIIYYKDLRKNEIEQSQTNFNENNIINNEGVYAL